MEINDAIHGKLDVVARDTHLAGHIQRDFLLRVLVGHTVEEGNQKVQTRLQYAVELAQAFDDVRLLLRHNADSLKAEYDDRGQNNQRQTQKFHNISLV